MNKFDIKVLARDFGLGLLFLCSFTAFAGTYKTPAISGKMDNYTALATDKIHIVVRVRCNNGWGGYIKDTEAVVSIDRDGRYEIPATKTRCHSVWGTTFNRSIRFIYDGVFALESYFDSEKMNHVLLLEVQAKQFSVPQWTSGSPSAVSAVESYIDVTAITEGANGITKTSDARLRGVMGEDSIAFQKSYLLFETGQEPQSIRLNYEMIVRDSHDYGNIFYGKKIYNQSFSGEIIDLPFDSVVTP